MMASRYLIFIFALLALAVSPVFASGNGNGNGGEGKGGDGFAKLWLNISDSYYGDVWDEETNIYNGTDFQLNVTNTGSSESKNTTIITSLHPLTYPGIVSVSVNGHVIPQSEFGFGTPGWEKCNGGYHSFPSHGVFPANYSLYDVGNIPAHGSILVTINISSSSPNPKTHFDAVGFKMHEDEETEEDELCWSVRNPESHDAGTNGEDHEHNAPFFPSSLIPMAIGLAAPVAAFKFSR